MSVKIMTIVGTRPEIIKLSRVIHELEQRTEHILVHTGQNFDYELNEIFFNQFNLKKPDFFLDATRDSLAHTVGNIISKADEVLEQVRPDAVLILGDTNSSLAAYSAKRRKIPIFHMEAGNRCFDQRVPEEINRKIVDNISDINMPYTEHARGYLIREGFKPETVIRTGSPMREVLEFYRDDIERSTVLEQLSLEAGKFFLVSAHREENVDNEQRLNDLLNTLNYLIQKYDFPLIVSTHPRTRKRLEKIPDETIGSKIQFIKPFGFFEYNHLQQKAFCVISDSGTITEESALLNFPAITIRQAHERPEGMDEGTLIMCGLKPEQVSEAIETVTAQQSENMGARAFNVPLDYQPNNVSKKVVRIILSYIDYINRTVWFK